MNTNASLRPQLIELQRAGGGGALPASPSRQLLEEPWTVIDAIRVPKSTLEHLRVGVCTCILSFY